MSSTPAPTKEPERILDLTCKPSQDYKPDAAHHSTFHLFLSLPVELQLEIWKIAAGTLRRLEHYHLSYLNHLSNRSPLHKDAYYFPPKEWWYSSQRDLMTMRLSMLHSCRTARLLVLEVMKKEFEEVKNNNEVDTDIDIEYYSDQEDEDLEKEEFLVERVEIVKGLIEGMKRVGREN